MKKVFGKKQAILAAMVLLLGAAVYLNYYVSSNVSVTTGTNEQTTTTTTAALGESQFVSNTTAAPAANDALATARADRETAREEALAILQETLSDVKFDEAGQQKALETAAKLASAVEREAAVENLIKAKGFEDCVAYIADDYCHVTVKAASLTEAQTLQIAEIITAQTDVPPANINILSVE